MYPENLQYLYFWPKLSYLTYDREKILRSALIERKNEKKHETKIRSESEMVSYTKYF